MVLQSGTTGHQEYKELTKKVFAPALCSPFPQKVFHSTPSIKTTSSIKDQIT